jgi:hypothetical protein
MSIRFWFSVFSVAVMTGLNLTAFYPYKGNLLLQSLLAVKGARADINVAVFLRAVYDD